VSSRRLGAALAEHVLALPGKRKFVLVEGVSEDLAEAMAAGWQDSELRLAIASRNPDRFGARALQGVAATGLRNQGGVCLVVCAGAQLADRQSLRAFRASPRAISCATTPASRAWRAPPPRRPWTAPRGRSAARSCKLARRRAPAQRPSRRT
jgi:hypothetical protein